MSPDVAPDEPPVEPESDEPESEPDTALAVSATVRVSEPEDSLRVPLNVPADALLKLICSCAPVVEFTFAADSVVAPAENPVPETDTVVELDRFAPCTITVEVCVLLTVTEPKSMVEPLAGEENAACDEDDPETVALSVTLITVEPLVSVKVPV